MTYRIKLENFEGPLDLLLFFIHRDKINIYDIPISHITNEFLEYLRLMRLLSLSVAGDFIVMASTLMQIKARMLLPKPQDPDGEIEDPRSDLVRRLLEYRQFREASVQLGEKFDFQSQHYAKGRPMPASDTREDPNVYVRNISLFDLLSIFRETLSRMPDPVTYEIHQEEVNLDEKIRFILDRIQSGRKALFSEIMSEMQSKLHVIVTFMAILELMRKKLIQVIQDATFSEIEIVKGSEAKAE